MPTSKVTVHFSCPVERVWQVVTDRKRQINQRLVREECLCQTIRV